MIHSLSILVLSLSINLLQPRHLLVEFADHDDEDNEVEEGSEEQIESEEEILDISRRKLENLEGNI